MSHLRPGIVVNVVLKEHQRSGKLTTGQISEILTRGDHPRGIKVRLSSGEIGRVQSLSLSSEHIAAAQNPPYVQTSFASDYENSPNHSGGRRRGRFASQEDYRQNTFPLESRSLADYIRIPSSSKTTHSTSSTAVQDTIQGAMEKEFPKLDTALIAAILTDHEDINDARDTMLDARPIATILLDYVNRYRPNHHLDTGTAPSSIKINLASGFLKFML